MKFSCTLALIVRNEADNLRAMLPRIPLDFFDDVLAVDGRSGDDTVDVLRKAGIRVHVQSRPGLGAAMMEARRQIRTETFVFFHPDGNENPDDLPRMLMLLKEGNPFVVASRMTAGASNEEDGKIFRWRKWANKTLTTLANRFFSRSNVASSDAINGFRGISCQAFDRMKLSSEDLTIDYQMVIRALKLGIPIREFPTTEMPRLNGDTNFSSLVTGLAELRLLWCEFFDRGVR